MISLLILAPEKDYELELSDHITSLVTTLKELLIQPSSLITTKHALHSLFFAIWSMIWTPTENNPWPDPTIRCLAFLSIKTGGGFHEPVNVTPIIAKFERVLRLTMLQEIHKSMDQYAQCLKLQVWFTEKRQSTFNSLRSLQHQGSSIAYRAVGTPRIWWTDRETFLEMLYCGTHITFDDICKTFVQLEDEAIKLWEKEVLMGLQLHIAYTNLADDLANKDIHYSLFSDPQNKCFSDKKLLLQKILDTAHLETQFLLNRQGSKIWNLHALREWMQSYAKFEALLLIRMEMLSGGPSRGTELTALNYVNTGLRPQRNLLAFGNYIGMLRQYTKTQALSGKDKFLPHAFDAITSDLIVQDLALARPFAIFAAKLIYPNQVEKIRLYQERLLVNNGQEFTSIVLSNEMVRWTMPTTKYKLTLNPWRHICIGFKRKLCPAATKLVEEEDDEYDTIQALQSGHTRNTENRLYGLSPDVYAGAAEDIIPYFLEASTDWQIKTHTVPGGLALPYWKATHKHFDGLVAENKILPQKLLKRTTTNASSSSTNILQQILHSQTLLMEKIAQFQLEQVKLTEKISKVEAKLDSLLEIESPHSVPLFSVLKYIHC